MLKWFSGEEGEPGAVVSTHVLIFLYLTAHIVICVR